MSTAIQPTQGSLAGLQYLTGGGQITTAMVTSAIAAGYQGIYLDARFVWNAAGLVLQDIQNFTIESRMTGSIGYNATITYDTNGYVQTGSGADGIQIFGTVGAGASGITFRGVSLVGSNTNAVLHAGGRHRRMHVENCFIYNTNNAVGAYGLIDDTQLNNANGEDNTLLGCSIAGAYAAIGIGINDQAQHVNDSVWADITTSGGVYAIVMNNGGNHQFINYYDRSHSTTATVYNHGGHIIFIGGENGNDGTTGGITYLQDSANANTVLRDATITAGASSPSNILNLSSGNFSLLGKMRSNNACTLNVTGGTLYLADPASGLGNVTVSGSGGAVWITNSYMGAGNAPTITWSGTPALVSTGVVVSGHANAQTTPNTVTFTPPTQGMRFRVSVWIQVTVAGTSTVPVLAFKQYQGTAFSQTVPMWQMDGAATAPTYLCATVNTFMGSWMGETDGSATPITLTITPTGSTYRYSVVIERLT